MESGKGEDVNYDHAHSTDIPMEGTLPFQDDLQPHLLHPLDSASDQLPQDDPTAGPAGFPCILQSPASSIAHIPLATCDSDLDKMPAIRSPLNDMISDTPNSGSDEDSRVSLPNNDADDNFSLKLSTEGSDTASVRFSAEPEAVSAVEEKCVPIDEPLVAEESRVSHDLNGKTELPTCLMPSLESEGNTLDTEQQRDPATSYLGSTEGLNFQESLSSLHGTDQLLVTMVSTEEKEDNMAVDDENAAGSGVAEEPTLAGVYCDKSKDSKGKLLETVSPSSRATKKRLFETKSLGPVRKYNTRRSKASSVSSLLQLQPQVSHASQSCEEYALPLVQSERNEDEVKKSLVPLAALESPDADLTEKRTTILMPTTNTLTVITPTYSMSATFVSDVMPTPSAHSTSTPTTFTPTTSIFNTSTPTMSTPTTSMHSNSEIKTSTKRGRGRPRKYPVMQGEESSKEKAGCIVAVGVGRKQQNSIAGTKRPAQQHDRQTAKDEGILAEEGHDRDVKKCKTSDPSDDKQVERRRSLRERPKVPLLEGIGIFTQGKKPRKSSSSYTSDGGPDVGKSSKDPLAKRGSSSSQGASPTNQVRTPRRNSSRSYARSPRKKQANRRSDEGILVHRNWLCALCNHGNSFDGLGYLYGPYRCQEKSESHGNKSSPEKESQDELWVHVGCAVWTPGVCLVGSELKGLQQAVEEGKTAICSLCDKPGATISCMQEHCQQRFHLPCVSSKGCQFLQEQYRIYCPAHT